MTIEEEFFKAFGIEPDCSYLFLIDEKGINEAARTLSLGSKADLKRFIVNCGRKGRVVKSTNSPHIYYPEITDRKLLELICIHNDYVGCNIMELIPKSSIESVKDELLCKMIYCLADKYLYKNFKEDIKNKVRKLFKEE